MKIIIGLIIYSVKGYSDFQKSRINFFNHCFNCVDNEYQVCNAFIVIYIGGLTVVKIGKSTQKYLYIPKTHTDTFFLIISEENGLFGLISLTGIQLPFLSYGGSFTLTLLIPLAIVEKIYIETYNKINLEKIKN